MARSRAWSWSPGTAARRGSSRVSRVSPAPASRPYRSLGEVGLDYWTPWLAWDGEAAQGGLGASLSDFDADPADRFITATALRHQACLLTADRLILAWSGPLQRTPADT